MYRATNFNGIDDANLWDVIDNGQVIEATGGNWDLIEYGGMIYYIAKANTGARSGAWGTLDHFRKHKREQLEHAAERYKKQIKEA